MDGRGADGSDARPSAHAAHVQPASPSSPKSPGRRSRPLSPFQFGRGPRGKTPTRQKTSQSARSRSRASQRSNSGYGAGEEGDELHDLEDGLGGATIFNTRDRPDLIPQESFAVGGGKSRPEGRSGSFDNRASWRMPSFPSLPPMPDLPNLSLLPTKASTRDSRRSKSADQRVQNEATLVASPGQVDVATPVEPDKQPAPLKHKLADLHAKHPNLKNMSKPLLPIASFPGQGTGTASEFNQEAPIWSRQPYKWLYFIYFGLSVGLIFLPWFALSSVFRSQRARPSWSWKRSTLVKLYRHGTRLTFRTYTSLSRDLTKEVPHSKTIRAKFVWVPGLPDELIRGHVRATMLLQGIKPTRTCGFWYGERDGGGGVGQKAVAGEKVVYHLHGGAYWIGTAHEKDVTAAVNMQVLRALSAIYHSGQSKASSESMQANGTRTVPNGSAQHDSNAKDSHCKRAFSLDYRLCVPGKPEMGSYPAALIDSIAGYLYLIDECGFEPKNIIVAGDSAGGNLALAMCRYLRDEGIAKVPGAMLLLSPWVDTSRSHSGPTEAPNKFSSSYRNGKCDIISPSLAFRNTAVSALLGKLAARETYRNPYLSSVSLQLPIDKGGSGPNWGFEGFPRRVYICTGSAELSYDQHLTLAYRLAAGSKERVPIHRGDKLSIDADPYEMAARLAFPRPESHEITLWPSAQGTPAGTPLNPPTGWDSARRKRTNSNQRSKPSSLSAMTTLDQTEEANGDGTKEADGEAMALQLPEKARERVKMANGGDRPLQNSAISNDSTREEPGTEHTSNGVTEKDTESGMDVTHMHGEQTKSATAKQDNLASTPSHGRTSRSNSQALSSMPMQNIIEGQQSEHSGPPLDDSYFELGGEDRTVILDECKDAIHDYTLCEFAKAEGVRIRSS